MFGLRRECSRPDELVVQRKVRPIATRSVVRHVLPPTGREETVIRAGHELSAVLECHAIGRLDRGPVVKHFGHPVARVSAPPHGSIDEVAWAHVCDRLGPSVPHKDRRCTPYAVHTRMRASAIRVERPAERHSGCVRHLVQRGLRPDLVETRVEGLGGVEGADRGRLPVAGEDAGLLFFDLEVVPAHERMFAHWAAVYPTGLRSWSATRGLCLRASSNASPLLAKASPTHPHSQIAMQYGSYGSCSSGSGRTSWTSTRCSSGRGRLNNHTGLA